VLDEDQPVRTHLSAFIDCHSRYLVTARYCYRQTLDILIDTLLRVWSVHGASRELYVDNAKIYDADALKAACSSTRRLCDGVSAYTSWRPASAARQASLKKPYSILEGCHARPAAAVCKRKVPPTY